MLIKLVSSTLTLAWLKSVLNHSEFTSFGKKSAALYFLVLVELVVTEDESVILGLTVNKSLPIPLKKGDIEMAIQCY